MGEDRGNRRVLWVLRCLVAALCLLCALRSVGHVSVVKGNSMRPNIHDGDRLVVDRLTPRLGDLSRFDVVILANPRNPDEDFIKRIVGLPGERIGYRRGRLTVNGRVVPEFFFKISNLEAEHEWVVPQGAYFVMGDNRPVSSDSREFGVIRREMIRGKVRLCLWPLDRVGAVTAW